MQNVGALLSCQDGTRRVFAFIIQAYYVASIPLVTLTSHCLAGMQEAGFEDDVVQPSFARGGIGSQCLNQNQQ